MSRHGHHFGRRRRRRRPGADSQVMMTMSAAPSFGWIAADERQPPICEAEAR